MDFLKQNGDQTKVKVGPKQQSLTKLILLNVDTSILSVSKEYPALLIFEISDK